MFMPTTGNTRQVQAQGNKSSKIAIIGDFSDSFDQRSLRPFTGPPGSVLEQCLHGAGLIRGECYITNAVKVRALESDYINEKKKTLTDLGEQTAEWLANELADCDANVLVACGDYVFRALTGQAGVHVYRGYFFESRWDGRKVLPIIHPRDAVWGAYTRRHLISTDLRKAKSERDTRELVRPDRQLVYAYHTVEEALEWLEYLNTCSELAVDIEVINFAISCINFSPDPKIGCVIPLSQGWNLEEECRIRRALQQVLGNGSVKKVFQNCIFDLQFMLAQEGFEVAGQVDDTMIAHSVTYPELPKGLGFLGSVYCGTQEYWKDLVKFNDIKEES